MTLETAIEELQSCITELDEAEWMIVYADTYGCEICYRHDLTHEDTCPVTRIRKAVKFIKEYQWV
jgi:hypothetical protein